jgi:hypothetical protein
VERKAFEVKQPTKTGEWSFVPAPLASNDFQVVQVRNSLQKILAEYGTIAIVVYFTLFFAVFASAWVAMHLGWQPASTAGNVGLLAGAYLFTKVTQVFRIAATLAITPIAARVYARFRPSRTDVVADAETLLVTPAPEPSAEGPLR